MLSSLWEEPCSFRDIQIKQEPVYYAAFYDWCWDKCKDLSGSQLQFWLWAGARKDKRNNLPSSWLFKKNKNNTFWCVLQMQVILCIILWMLFKLLHSFASQCTHELWRTLEYCEICLSSCCSVAIPSTTERIRQLLSGSYWKRMKGRS